MRLGMVAESLLEFIALKARLVPVPLALTFGGLTVSRMLTTCARLGIFAELAKAPRTADELATALALDPEATARLLQALARRNGALASENGRYRLGPTWAQWLDPESKQSVVHALAMFDDLWQIWADLPALLRDGARVDAYQGLLRQQETSTRFGGHDRDTLRRHLLGLAEMARHQAPSILKKPRLPKAPGRVLDVGTGHGEFAISIVRAH